MGGHLGECGILQGGHYPVVKGMPPSPSPRPPSPSPTPHPPPSPSPVPPPPPTPTPPAPPSPGDAYYGVPPCRSDEQNVDMGGTQICSPYCSDNDPCPTDVPAGTTATPVCSDNAEANDRICFLTCTEEQSCPAGASCHEGVCSYPKMRKSIVV